MKRILLFVLILLLSFYLSACMNEKIGRQVEADLLKSNKIDEETNSNVYQNTEYGFSFSLPESWKGYTIVTDKWEGLSIRDSKVIETGILIYIRNPKWTSENPWQDIPIMILTLPQWDSLQQYEFRIGTAANGPSELGRNFSYVFQLPAHYNYAFPTGWEEVKNILNSNPLMLK